MSIHHHYSVNIIICTGFPGAQTGLEGCLYNQQGVCQRTGGSKQTAVGMCGHGQKWCSGSPKWYSKWVFYWDEVGYVYYLYLILH